MEVKIHDVEQITLHNVWKLKNGVYTMDIVIWHTDSHGTQRRRTNINLFAETPEALELPEMAEFEDMS